jgi:hypothetical protein
MENIRLLKNTKNKKLTPALGMGFFVYMFATMFGSTGLSISL